ncbi:AGC family protein kinase [Trichomonas vaginalis G3]|uniref:AGC family protein kinase n=1 Tax=Trichomonas vaginalis (strain ATCC PRA-98 / G3) TaxID=412133 RepID=A2F5L0_TRIV3|nr:protein serine/threonine kinase protein [Trichomonas vaginalis G3]EAX99773.1 AGC family protein kinase [Trichomonas vaginalis G3]KAI5494407.1 protein serine/threonine kinase protein [Trichomonas vaginalis G3]|eukprot:XP_001312703.1 AGC family protein kinase [Trichomonas vaginalis G3]
MNCIEIDFFNKERIKFENVIGVGGYGVLYKVYSEQYKIFFAMKKIPEKLFNKLEVDCLISIDNPNVVNLYKSYKSNGFIYLLLEYCPLDLDRLLHGNTLSNEELIKYTYQMILGIKACHENNVAHGDIKPSNFLIDKYGRIKVCDFGLSSYLNQESRMSNFRGTLLFIAPEILKQEEFCPVKADIWALGITIYLMATQRYPYEGHTSEEVLKQIESKKISLKHIKNEVISNIISKCLQIKPNKRATINDLHKIISKEPCIIRNPRSTRREKVLKNFVIRKQYHDVSC